MEVAGVSRLRAAERAVWPVGYARTAGSAAWFLGPNIQLRLDGPVSVWLFRPMNPSALEPR
eukprot:15483317-Alexandrium_andersonii.AAC.1